MKRFYLVLLLLLGLLVIPAKEVRALPSLSAKPLFTDLKAPTSLASHPKKKHLLYAVLEGDRIYAFDVAKKSQLEVLFDARSMLAGSKNKKIINFDFHPDFENRPFLLVTLTRTGMRAETMLIRFGVMTDLDMVDPASIQKLLSFHSPDEEIVETPINFGTDGNLFIGVGPGGADRSENQAQSPKNFYGSVLRIDVAHGNSYRAPVDNPFAIEGRSLAEPETWAFGFRNPIAVSVDPKNGDLWVLDEGTEFLPHELNKVRISKNYGWPIFHGTACQRLRFECGGTTQDPPVTTLSAKEFPAPVVAGVYRRSHCPGLDGQYLFADGSGKVYAFPVSGGAKPQQIGDVKRPLSAFHIARSGRLFVSDAEKGEILELSCS